MVMPFVGMPLINWTPGWWEGGWFTTPEMDVLRKGLEYDVPKPCIIYIFGQKPRINFLKTGFWGFERRIFDVVS